MSGVIARRLGVATPGLRRLDSVADSIFYAAAVFAAWHLYPAAITDRSVPLGVLLLLELGLAISIRLRQWQTDVPTILHALRLERGART